MARWLQIVLLTLLDAAMSELLCPHEMGFTGLGKKMNWSDLLDTYSKQEMCVSLLPVTLDDTSFPPDVYSQARLKCLDLDENGSFSTCRQGIFNWTVQDLYILQPVVQRIAMAVNTNDKGAFALVTNETGMRIHYSVGNLAWPTGTVGDDSSRYIQPPLCEFRSVDENGCSQMSTVFSCYAPPSHVRKFHVLCVTYPKNATDCGSSGACKCASDSFGPYCRYAKGSLGAANYKYRTTRCKGCDHGDCLFGEDDKFECKCYPGTTGANCNQLEKDPCETVSCHGRGKCYKNGFEFGCKCNAPNVRGPYCELVLSGQFALRPSLACVLANMSLLFVTMYYMLYSSEAVASFNVFYL